MIRGGCLCGAVRFELLRAIGPFELCHCSRCRKASGSAYLAAVGVRAQDFRLVAGREQITSYELPVLEAPPGYARPFCRRCGCLAPEPEPRGPWFEIAAGLLDDDPGLRPDRHIMVEHKAAWTTITDGLPQLDKQALLRLRGG
jgi:hypothetical protein